MFPSVVDLGKHLFFCVNLPFLGSSVPQFHCCVQTLYQSLDPVVSGLDRAGTSC